MKKFLSILTLLLAVCSGALADGYYTPTADEVIILNDVYSASATTAGYSTHSAVAWAGTASSSSKTAGDPSKNGDSSSKLNCYSIKNNGGGKNISLSISGVSKIIIYRETGNLGRYPQLIMTEDGASSSTTMSGSGLTGSPYLHEFEIDGTKSYSIALQGWDPDKDGGSKQDIYVYAVKLIKYVARTISTETLSGVKIGGTALTENAASAGYSVSGSTITLTDVAYVQPTNVTLTNHIVYTDETTEDKNVAVTFGETPANNFWEGTATIGTTTYTVKVPYEAQSVTAVTINGTAISADDLATLTSTKSVTIDGSALNGIGKIDVTLSGGTTTVTRTFSGNDVAYAFSLNGSDNYTVTLTGVKKTYTALGDIVYYSKDGTDATGANTNTLTANGITFSMEDTSKTLQYGDASAKVTIGTNEYQSVKLSTGSAVNVTFPAYKKATKVKVYGWSANGNGKLYSMKETKDGEKSVNVNSDVFFATNAANSNYPSVYEYNLDNWESMYFSAGGSPSQPFVVMDFVFADDRAELKSFAFSGGNTSVYTDALTTFAAPTLAATYGGSDVLGDLTVTYASSNTAVATVDEETGEVTLTGTAGTAKITATFAGNATYQEASANYTISVAVNPVGNHTITYALDVTSSEDKNKTDINSTNSATSSYLTSLVGITNNTGGSYTNGSKANLTVKIATPASYDENKYMSVGFSVQNGFSFVPSSVSVKAQPVSTNKDVKLVLTDGVNSIETTETLAQGKIAEVTLSNDEGITFTGTVTLKIYCYGATDTYRLGSPITISGAVVEAPITLTPAKTYTTLTSAKALDFTGTGLTAFIVKDNDLSDGYVTMTEVQKVPANTGLVIKAEEPGTAVNVPILTETADDVEGNLMEGSATEETEIAANGGYILSDGEFHPSSGNGKLAAGKAYLHIAVSSARVLRMKFNDETTGIGATLMNSEKVNNEVYNLNGQRVAQPTKGLYIVGGRKVVVK